MLRWIVLLFISWVCATAGLAVEPAAQARKHGELVEAGAAVLMDRQTGLVLWSKNPDARLPMASTTKIMTAMVILDRGADRLREVVTISKHAASVGGSSLLRQGDKITLEDLLKASLIRSSNRATVAAGEHLAGSEQAFVGWMNDKAKELGLKNTHFMNPHGLHHPQHYSSARDLAVITRKALSDYPRIGEIVASGRPSEPITVNPRGQIMIQNRNKLLNEPVPGIPDATFDGVKTGYVRASGRCLVASATRNGWQLIAVLLNSPELFAEAETLMYHGFRRYEWKIYASELNAGATIPVRYGKRDKVPLGTKGTLAAPAPRAEFGMPVTDRIVYEGMDAGLRAPVQRGEEVGMLTVLRNGAPLVTAPAITLATVPAAPWVGWMRGILITGITLAVIIIAGIIYGAHTKAYRSRRRRLTSGG